LPSLDSLDIIPAANQPPRRSAEMDVIEISGQWYAVRWEDEKHEKFTIVSGPYAEKHWAESMARIREI
jgi:hypothetical protein